MQTKNSRQQAGCSGFPVSVPQTGGTQAVPGDLALVPSRQREAGWVRASAFLSLEMCRRRIPDSKPGAQASRFRCPGTGATQAVPADLSLIPSHQQEAGWVCASALARAKIRILQLATPVSRFS